MTETSSAYDNLKTGPESCAGCFSISAQVQTKQTPARPAHALETNILHSSATFVFMIGARTPHTSASATGARLTSWLSGLAAFLEGSALPRRLVALSSFSISSRLFARCPPLCSSSSW